MKTLLYNPALLAPTTLYSLLRLPPRKEECVSCDYLGWRNARLIDLSDAEYAMLVMRYNPKGKPTSDLYVDTVMGKLYIYFW